MKFISSFLTLIGFANASTEHTDPCRALCEAFSADRRGNGMDLCDNEILSRCTSNPYGAGQVCTSLYWSATGEPGVSGFVYSADGLDITSEEMFNPVTCDQAARVLEGEINDDVARTGVRAITTAAQIFMHLRTVSDLFNSGVSTFFIETFREMHNHLQSGNDSLIEMINNMNTMVDFEISVNQVLEGMIAGANLVDEIQIRDTSLNNSTVIAAISSGNNVQFNPDSGDFELVGLVDENHTGFVAINGQWYRTDISGLTRINHSSQLLSLQITTAIYQRI